MLNIIYLVCLAVVIIFIVVDVFMNEWDRTDVACNGVVLVLSFIPFVNIFLVLVVIYCIISELLSKYDISGTFWRVCDAIAKFLNKVTKKG